jgi:uncharacterized protein
MDRRSFLSGLAFFSGGLALAGNSFARRAIMIGSEGDNAPLRAYGYGELVPTAARNSGEMILALPRGFEYNVIGRAGDIMSDGRPTPPLHDGQWTFKVGRELRIVRNHEVSNLSLPRENTGIGRRNHYDEMAGGGTTTLIIDPKTNAVVRHFGEAGSVVRKRRSARRSEPGSTGERQGDFRNRTVTASRYRLRQIPRLSPFL